MDNLQRLPGLGAQAMAGGSYAAPVFTVSWPSGEFGGMGLEGAVRLAYRNELAAIGDPEEMEIDTVIDPAETRRWIMRGLKMHKPPAGERKRRPFVDTW